MRQIRFRNFDDADSIPKRRWKLVGAISREKPIYMAQVDCRLEEWISPCFSSFRFEHCQQRVDNVSVVPGCTRFFDFIEQQDWIWRAADTDEFKRRGR
jgi:hypothetical protein